MNTEQKLREALPTNALGVRQFIGQNCAAIHFGVPGGEPSDDDLYEVSAHDLLSAFSELESISLPATEKASAGSEPVGRVRIDSGEVHIVPFVRDAEISDLRAGQQVHAAPVSQPAPAKLPELSDGELDVLRQADNGALNFVTLREFRVIARAVLAALAAKKGQPT